MRPRSASRLRSSAQASAYLPFDEDARTVIAGRLKLGAILGGRIPEVPGSRRFYAGGGGTVRGYKYQSIGPRFPSSRPTGGTSVTAATVEYRQRIGESFGAAVFVDAGQVDPDELTLLAQRGGGIDRHDPIDGDAVGEGVHMTSTMTERPPRSTAGSGRRAASARARSRISAAMTATSTSRVMT